MSDEAPDDQLSDGEPDVDPQTPDFDEPAEDEGAQALHRLFAADGPADFDEEMFAGPLFWPAIPAADIEQELTDLRTWVDSLLERYEHLDVNVIPRCWWRHNGHIEALQALRDHERMSFADSSPAQAAASWQRELHFIEMRLREWTLSLGCGQEHREPYRTLRAVDEDKDAWQAMLAEQKRERERRELGG